MAQMQHLMETQETVSKDKTGTQMEEGKVLLVIMKSLLGTVLI